MSARHPVRLVALRRRGHRVGPHSRVVLVRPGDPAGLAGALDAAASLGLPVVAVADLGDAVGLVADEQADVVVGGVGGLLGELEISPVAQTVARNGGPVRPGVEWLQPSVGVRERPRFVR